MKTIRNIDLCDLFYSHSVGIWQRLEFCRKQHIPCTETTITQNLLFGFWQCVKSGILPVMLFEARNEKANGNDLEFLIETPKGFLLLALQAKIIKRNGKYKTLPHSVNGTAQIDRLLHYAKKRKGLAAYMFYNYIPEFEPTSDMGVMNMLDPEDFGCTVAAAEKIKEEYYTRGGKNTWRIPSFMDLHPGLAVPFHWIVCTTIKSPKIDAELLSHIGYKSGKAKFYKYEELLDDDYWRDMLPGAAIGRLSPQYESKERIFEQAEDFFPKYRVLLLRERRKRGIYRLS